MNDITIIFLTLNTVPKKWAEYQKSVLLEAIDGAPVITISREPLDWGTNLIQDAEPSVNNIYRQVLRGAKLATTPYIAIAEDDHLYPEVHFQFRPPEGTPFAYEGSRWGLFTWGEPTFYHKKRISNGSMIALREEVIDSLEERFRRYPNSNRIGELGKEHGTKLNKKETMFFWSTVPTIFLSHINAIDKLEQEKRKRMSMIRAYDIPYWGKASDVASKFV